MSTMPPTDNFLNILAAFLLLGSQWSQADRRNPSNQQNENITKLLDSLLEGYDKDLRPDFGGPPTEIVTNMAIRSMGPLSEEMMVFSLDAYFRQEWTDRRLSFNYRRDHFAVNISELRPSIKMLEHIWKPDTFFLNGRNSYLHTITYSNKLFRISDRGNVLFSQRLTIKSACPIYLHKYPLDSQSCPLLIGSYGYDSKDVAYTWKKNPINRNGDITMSQFTLTDISHKNNYPTGANHAPGFLGNRTVLYVEFVMKREIGYYLLQFYLPCYLIVIISWVSFWINREATPARVTLGTTTLLTACTIGITGRTGIPKVPYSTAMDVFLLMCFSFVFAALVEYAGVNYFTKTERAEIMVEEEEHDPNSPLLHATYGHGGNIITTDINGHTIINVSEPRTKDSCWTMFMHCIRGNTKYRDFKALSKTSTLSVSKIDSLSKIIFPSSFTLLNILYWAGFLYYF